MNCPAIAGKRSVAPEKPGEKAIADIFEITTFAVSSVGAERPAPEARLLTTIYQNVYGRTPPKVQPKIAAELREIAERLDSSNDSDSGIAVVTSKRRGLTFGMVDVKKVKTLDAEDSARKIGIGLAKSGASVVVVENQSQLNKLFRLLDGEITIPSKRGLNLDAILTLNDLTIPEKYERHANLITSLDAYNPKSKRKNRDDRRAEQEIDSPGQGFELLFDGLSSVTFTVPNRKELRRALKLELLEAEAAKEDPNFASKAKLAPTELIQSADKVQIPPLIVNGNTNLKNGSSLAAEIFEGILQVTSMPKFHRGAVDRHFKNDQNQENGAAEPELDSTLGGVIKASSRITIPNRVVSVEELEERRGKFIAKLETGSPEDKIAAHAIQNEAEFQLAKKAGVEPSKDVGAWKVVYDASIAPTRREELKQSLLDGVAIVLAPREATASAELLSLIDFLDIPVQSESVRPISAGRIINNNRGLKNEQYQAEMELPWQLELAS